MKIFVAGHTGLVGSAIVSEIEQSDHTWCGAARSELDLTDVNALTSFLSFHKPDAVIVAAAKVGGIGANLKFPVEFLTENLKIELSIAEASFQNRIDRLLFLGSSCIYPRLAPQPISENALLEGPLEPSNEPYAVAKIAGLKLVHAYRNQHGVDWISAMPCNIYGPGDNFNLETGHVVPSLIRKIHEAKLKKEAEVALWGSGAPMREFLHSSDLASACIFLLENYSDGSPINIGSGEELSIMNLAGMISEIVGFDGEIIWDRSRPDGTPRKLLDSGRIHGLGWSPRIKLSEGLRETYEWYVEHQSIGHVS